MEHQNPQRRPPTIHSNHPTNYEENPEGIFWGQRHSIPPRGFPPEYYTVIEESTHALSHPHARPNKRGRSELSDDIDLFSTKKYRYFTPVEEKQINLLQALRGSLRSPDPYTKRVRVLRWLRHINSDPTDHDVLPEDQGLPAASIDSSYDIDAQRTKATPSSDTRPTDVVGEPNYRRDNLERNGIYLGKNDHVFPGHVNDVIIDLQRLNVQALSAQELDFNFDGISQTHTGVIGSEIGVRRVLYEFLELSYDRFSPTATDTPLYRIEEIAFYRQHCPQDLTGESPIARPRPDLIFGLHSGAVPLVDSDPLRSRDEDRQFQISKSRVYFPYLVIESKPMVGLYATLNELLGGAASSLNVCSKVLGARATVIAANVQPNAVDFYIMWMEGDRYVMKHFAGYSLTQKNQYWEVLMQFRRIHAWARTRRLEDINRNLQIMYDSQILWETSGGGGGNPSIQVNPAAIVTSQPSIPQTYRLPM